MSHVDLAQQLKAKILAKKLKAAAEQPAPENNDNAAAIPVPAINKQTPSPPTPPTPPPTPVPLPSVSTTPVVTSPPPPPVPPTPPVQNNPMPTPAPKQQQPKSELQIKIDSSSKDQLPPPLAKKPRRELLPPEGSSLNISINSNNIKNTAEASNQQKPEPMASGTDMKIKVPVKPTSPPPPVVHNPSLLTQEDAAKLRKPSESLQVTVNSNSTTRVPQNREFQVRIAAPEESKQANNNNSQPQHFVGGQNTDTKVRVNKHHYGLRSMDKLQPEKSLTINEPEEIRGRRRKGESIFQPPKEDETVPKSEQKPEQNRVQIGITGPFLPRPPVEPPSLVVTVSKPIEKPAQKQMTEKITSEPLEKPIKISNSSQATVVQNDFAQKLHESSSSTQKNNTVDNKLQAMEVEVEKQNTHLISVPLRNTESHEIPEEGEVVDSSIGHFVPHILQNPQMSKTSIEPAVVNPQNLLPSQIVPEMTITTAGHRKLSQPQESTLVSELPVKKVHKLRQKIVFKELELLQRALDNLEVSLDILEKTAQLKRENKLPESVYKKLHILQELLSQ